jgi:hypothetical protein
MLVSPFLDKKETTALIELVMNLDHLESVTQLTMAF